VKIISPEYSTFDYDAYNEKRQVVIDEFTKEKAMEIITDRLNDKIKM